MPKGAKLCGREERKPVLDKHKGNQPDKVHEVCIKEGNVEMDPEMNKEWDELPVVRVMRLSFPLY